MDKLALDSNSCWANCKLWHVLICLNLYIFIWINIFIHCDIYHITWQKLILISFLYMYICVCVCMSVSLSLSLSRSLSLSIYIYIYIYIYNLFDLFFPQDLNVCPEDESMILSSFYNTIASLSVKQGMYCNVY